MKISVTQHEALSLVQAIRKGLPEEAAYRSEVAGAPSNLCVLCSSCRPRFHYPHQIRHLCLFIYVFTLTLSSKGFLAPSRNSTK